MHSALLITALAVAATVALAVRLHARRRYAKMKMSGGRKSLALNLFHRP